MSVLNQASDGTKSVLWVVYDQLGQSSGVFSREKLESLIAPRGDKIARDKVTQTINTWLDLGLLQWSNSKEDILVAEPLLPFAKKTKFSQAGLRKLVLQRLMCPENSPDQVYWESEKNRASDFTRTCAWTLAQDIYTFKAAWKNIDDLEQKQFRKDDNNGSVCRAIQNRTRWDGYRAWAQFAGFITYPSNGNLEVDPTTAMALMVDEVFGSSNEVPADEFVDAFSRALPVLDRGVCRERVTEALDQQVVQPYEPTHCSQSLSRGLLGLEARDLLTLVDKADARQLALTCVDRTVLRRFAVVRKGAGV